MRLSVGIDDQATQAIAKMAETLGKSRGLMDAIGQHLVSSALRRFQTQAGPDGKPWAPLSKATLRRRGPNARALQASGRLRLSVTFLSSARSVEVGSNLIYAALMQLGGTIEQPARSMPVFRRQKDVAGGRSRFVKESQSDFKTYHEVGAHAITVPGRPYIGIGPADERAIARLAHDYMMGAAS